MFRKYSRETSARIRTVNDDQTSANTTRQADPSHARRVSGRAFSSRNSPSGTTKDELWEAFSQFGRYPGIRHAYVRTAPMSPFYCPDGAY